MKCLTFTSTLLVKTGSVGRSQLNKEIEVNATPTTVNMNMSTNGNENNDRANTEDMEKSTTITSSSNSSSSSSSSSSKPSKELKRVINTQYNIFTSQLEYLHGVLKRVSRNYNGLEILASSSTAETDISSNKSQSSLEADHARMSESNGSEVKKRLLNAIEDIRAKANMTEEERVLQEAAQREQQSQREEKAKVKTNRRLPEVSS